MSTELVLQACAAQGWRVNEENGTVDGVVDGVAFRAHLSPCTIALSVSLPEKRLPRLQAQISAIDPEVGEVTVAHEGFGILITLPVTPLDGARFVSYLRICIQKAVEATDAAFDNKHISGTADPFYAYLLGAIGALLGALVGVIPWLVTGFFGWQLWLLGGLVGIASFYGYQIFRGAHRTGFAIGTILVCSLVAVIGCEAVTNTYQNWQIAQELQEPGMYAYYYEYSGDYYEPLAKEDITVWEVVAFSLQGEELIYILENSLYGVLVCVVGVLLMKGRIQDYTHGHTYLRTRRFR